MLTKKTLIQVNNLSGPGCLYFEDEKSAEGYVAGHVLLKIAKEFKIEANASPEKLGGVAETYLRSLNREELEILTAVISDVIYPKEAPSNAKPF